MNEPKQPLPFPAPLPSAETADDFLAIDDLEILAVQVPEWKTTIHLRVLPADEGLVLNEAMQQLPADKKAEAIFILLKACLVTSGGKLLITSDEQVSKLRSRSQKVLLRIQKEALKLQGWLDESAAKNASSEAALVASLTASQPN